jgi:tetratricopeptide (TPR) repeat protein
MGSAHIQQGDLERGLECCNTALALASIPYDAAMARGIRGYAEIKAGRVDAGIAELREAFAWSETSHLRYTQLYQASWLAEGHLRRGDRASARHLIEDVLNTSRTAGYLHFEGRACWLTGECLAAEAPAVAEEYAEAAMDILERVGARNDLAKVMVTRAALRQRTGDVATARQLLEQASLIFQMLGTRDEPARVEAALTALDRGSPIHLLAGCL